MKTVKTLTLLALLSTFAMAQKEALVLGVSDYMGTQSDLAGVKKDVPRIKKLFEDWGFHVTVIQDAQSMDLESYLANYAKILGTEDSFIFYYSGHGYHVKDRNGDESDGEDEALVLSDGRSNKLFIDDALFGYLNAIKAKKMIILDSCHSGTAFKTFGDKPKPKSIHDNEVSGVIKTRAFRPQESKISGANYIVFAAAQDQEQSLDTSNGGLFTNAFLNQFKNGDTSTAFVNIRQNMESEIIQYCKQRDSKPHHPKLSASDTNLKYGSVDKFFKSKTVTRPTIDIKVTGSDRCNEGSLLDFEIDTQGKRGYLAIFSIEDNQPFMMYQSREPKQGVFHFRDFNIQPPIECYKACKGCSSEESVVYVVFSAQPVRVTLDPLHKTFKTEPLKNTKAFRHRETERFKPIIKRFKTIIY